ncbi:MAG: hypothetical protein Fur0025_26130 [Oscillatoriaceae cyanobacterium]
MGKLHLASLLSHLIPSPSHSELPNTSTTNLDQPLSTIEPLPLHPLVILPASVELAELWHRLKTADAQTDGQDWAIVSGEGKFLGLLESHRLLKFLLGGKEDRPTGEPPISPHLFSPLVSPGSGGEVLTLPIPWLVDVLDRLPWPLRLQTDDGMSVVDNVVWRSVVGANGRGEFTTGEGSEIIAPLPAIDSFREKTLNRSEANLEDRPHITSKDLNFPLAETCVLPGEVEPVWQFIKIPLPLRLSHIPGSLAEAIVEIPLHQKPTPEQSIAKLRDPPPSNGGKALWLVLARDVAEQQQLATELAAKNADLVRLNRLKDEFLACISHELKTPLTSVLGLSSLLKDQSVGKLNDRQARYAELIHRSGRHLMAVVNDILDLTRIETGQMELIAEPVRIEEVCSRAFEQATGREHLSSSATPGSGDDDRHFHLEIEPGLDTIVADELRLRQMLSHLLSNALKFTPKGRDIGLKVNRWESWIAFTVWDNGLGIPAEKQHLIFQKFQQLENPLIRQFEGTGLGLVLTQGIARAHGGDVTFISKEDHGSEFTILLPPCPPAANTSGVPVVRDKQLVLLVEAVPRFVESVTGMLSALGLRPCIARAGTDALEKARRLQPGAVLIDPLLPLLSGWDALTLIKSDPQTRHIPAVMMGTLADKKQALERHADGFLVLPVQEDALRDELTRLHCLQVNRESSPPAKLTVLRLIPTDNPSPNPLLADHITSDSSDNLRLLEAYDLDQAELLARIWQPHAILLDGISSMSDDVNGFLQELSEYPELGAVPLVTLDRLTTEAANKISGLSVFPCLQPVGADGSHRAPSSQLIDVIKVAAGMREKPTILVVDLWRLPEFGPPETEARGDEAEEGEPQRRLEHQEIGSPGVVVTFNPGRIHPSPAATNGLSTISSGNQSQDGAWLPALIQYLQTAGFKGTIASSWSEVWQQLQHQGVDLLVLYWPNRLQPSPILLEALRALGQVHSLPPVFVLRSRGFRPFTPATSVEKKSVLPVSGGVAIVKDGSFDLPEAESSLQNGTLDLDNGNMGGDFYSVVSSIAAKILPSSLSMSQLVHEIILSLQTR